MQILFTVQIHTQITAWIPEFGNQIFSVHHSINWSFVVLAVVISCLFLRTTPDVTTLDIAISGHSHMACNLTTSVRATLLSFDMLNTQWNTKAHEEGNSIYEAQFSFKKNR
jgi:hypothetical protein